MSQTTLISRTQWEATPPQYRDAFGPLYPELEGTPNVLIYDRGTVLVPVEIVPDTDPRLATEASIRDGQIVTPGRYVLLQAMYRGDTRPSEKCVFEADSPEHAEKKAAAWARYHSFERDSVTVREATTRDQWEPADYMRGF